MSKPLVADPKRQSDAATWHRQVFSLYGDKCYLCKAKARATDAAHVIGRAHLGKLRYATPEFGRPAHRTCHERQERGEIDFSLAIRRAAVRAHNKIAKVALAVPA